MSRRETSFYVGLPAVGILISAVVLPLLPTRWMYWFFSETGPVELATASLYFAAGIVGSWHLWKHRTSLPHYAQLLFGLFVVATTFVALEELSYGQHLFKFRSPEWFEEHNEQAEFNVHNLYGNKPSRYIRNAGSIVIPLFCVVLPLYSRRNHGAWQPGHWTNHLLPRTELIAIAVFAQLVTFPTKLPSEIVGRIPRLGELKELLWSYGALCYIVLMFHRHNRLSQAAESTQSSPVAEDDTFRRAA